MAGIADHAPGRDRNPRGMRGDVDSSSKRLARAHDHAGARARPGRPERHHRPHHRRRPHAPSRSAGRRRRAAGRRRQGRRRASRPHGRRRLYADGHSLRPCRGRGAVQVAALPHHRRLRDDQPHHRISVRGGDICRSSDPHARRPRRYGTLAAGAAAVRQRGQRIAAASRRRASGQDGERHVPARALSRQRAGDHRPDRAAHRLHRRLPDSGARNSSAPASCGRWR